MLKAHEPLLTGTVLLVFQPAEEGGGGARHMLETGALDNVTAMAGVHVWPTLPTGIITTKVCVEGDLYEEQEHSCPRFMLQNLRCYKRRTTSWSTDVECMSDYSS